MPVQRAHRPGTAWRWGLHASSTQLNSSTKAAFASGEFEKEKKKKIIPKDRHFMASRKPPDRVEGEDSRSPPA